MSQAIHRPLAAAIILFSALLLSLPASAQNSFRDSLMLAQKQIRDGTRDVIKEELLLSTDEATKFWPLYEKYEADMLAVEQRYIDLAAEFVALYRAGELSNDDADRMLDASFDIQMDSLQIRQRYLRRFRKILSGLQVARLYQLGNRVKVEVDATLAQVIPLADPT